MGDQRHLADFGMDPTKDAIEANDFENTEFSRLLLNMFALMLWYILCLILFQDMILQIFASDDL